MKTSGLFLFATLIAITILVGAAILRLYDKPYTVDINGRLFSGTGALDGESATINLNSESLSYISVQELPINETLTSGLFLDSVMFIKRNNTVIMHMAVVEDILNGTRKLGACSVGVSGTCASFLGDFPVSCCAGDPRTCSPWMTKCTHDYTLSTPSQEETNSEWFSITCGSSTFGRSRTVWTTFSGTWNRSPILVKTVGATSSPITVEYRLLCDGGVTTCMSQVKRT
jgi:hypothetical protein